MGDQTEEGNTSIIHQQRDCLIFVLLALGFDQEMRALEEIFMRHLPIDGSFFFGNYVLISSSCHTYSSETFFTASISYILHACMPCPFHD
jgi:hypothetical protein